MKKNLTRCWLICLLLASFFPGKAAGVLGAEIHYAGVAPGVFVIGYLITQDCQNTVFPNTKTLQISSNGCQPARNFTLNKVGGPNPIGNLYCRAIGNSCGSGAQANYQNLYYTATMIFTGPEKNCPFAEFKVQECPGLQAANISGTAATCSSVQALLMMPNSQEFIWGKNDLTIPHVEVNKPASISFLIAPGSNYPYSLSDSITYSLIPAKSDLNTALTYKAPYTFSNPVPSSTPVALNPRTGQFTFTPNLLHNSGQPGENDYVVAVEINVYREFVAGQYQKVGSIQSLRTVRIINSHANQKPEFLNVVANGVSVPANNVIQMQYGDSLDLQFATFDPDSGDSIEVVSSNLVNWVLRVTSTTGAQPTFHISGYVSPGINFIPVTIRDNACPVRNYTTRVFEVGVKLKRMGIKKPVKEAQFTVYPNPFSQHVYFSFSTQTNARQIVIFNLLGQQVDEISLKTVASSEQKVQWQNSSKFAAGTYVAKLIHEDKTFQTLKFTKIQ